MKKIIFFLAIFTGLSTTAQDLELNAVPFNTIETGPTFPGCESNDKKCFTEKVKEVVSKNFNTNLAVGLTGLQKIAVQFKINTDGTISDITVRAPNAALKTEAIRVISNLPQMEPAILYGSSVAVLYTLPIVFDVSNKKSSNFIIAPTEIQNN